MSEPNCTLCNAPAPDGNAEGTHCRKCVEAMIDEIVSDDERQRATKLADELFGYVDESAPEAS